MNPVVTYLIWCGVLGLVCGFFNFPRWAQNLGWAALTVLLAVSL